MKAKSVFENIEFERGKEPKEAMGVGRDAHMDQRIEKLKKDYSIQFPFESIHPGWRDHGANVIRILDGAYNDDQLDMFEYALEFLLKKFPDTDPRYLARILVSASMNGMPEYVIMLLEAGVKSENIEATEDKDEVIEMLWVLLKERLKNES